MAIPKAETAGIRKFIELMDELDRIDQQIRETRKACLLVIHRCLEQERQPDTAERAALEAIVRMIPESKKVKDPTFNFLAHDVIDSFKKATSYPPPAGDA